jgi:hypothetical protein
MSPKKNTLKYSRLLHLYLGVFAAPAIIFFSITGALQTFSLHETTRGSNYQPPKILVELGQLHKKQTLVVPDKKPQPPAPAKPVGEKSATEKPAPPAPHPNDAPPAKTKNLLPMKIFFLIVSISLLSSTFTGIYMAYKYVRNKTIVTVTLIAGVIIPPLLTLF